MAEAPASSDETDGPPDEVDRPRDPDEGWRARARRSPDDGEGRPTEAEGTSGEQVHESAPEARRRWALLLGVTTAVLVLDQATKLWVDGSFELASRTIPAGQPGGPTELLGDLVRIAKVYNDGAIFGLFDAVAPIMAVLTLLVVAGILWFEWRHGARSSPLVTIGLGLLLGGAIGNLIDRVRLGRVVDFVDMGIGSFRWYAWNVADAAVFVGILCLFGAALLAERGSAARSEVGRPA